MIFFINRNVGLGADVSQLEFREYVHVSHFRSSMQKVAIFGIAGF